MQILALDLEVTGLNPNIHQIIECGLVLYDTISKKRVKENIIIQHDNYIGEAFALALNKRIFDELKNPLKSKEIIIHNKFFIEYLSNFFLIHNIKVPVVLTGKNVGVFDLQFLKKYDSFNQEWFHHRILDVGSLYFDPLKDEFLPSFSECKKRAGLNENISHKAVDDANDVIDLITIYYKL